MNQIFRFTTLALSSTQTTITDGHSTLPAATTATGLNMVSLIFSVLTVATASSSPLCSLNGDVVDGKCICDPQWSGADCEQLVLLPAAPTNGFNLAGKCRKE